MTLNDIDYYGPMYVGTPLQSPTGENYMLYDTQSNWTYVPEVDDISFGWYDCSASSTCTDSGVNTYFSVDGWTG